MLRSWDWFVEVGGFNDSPLNILHGISNFFALVFRTKPIDFMEDIVEWYMNKETPHIHTNYEQKLQLFSNFISMYKHLLRWNEKEDSWRLGKWELFRCREV